MSRHVLNDGKTPDGRITSDLYDEHLVSLAPPPTLIGDYYKRGMSWYGFSLRYFDFLRGMEPEITNLVTRAIDGDITLLCIEETAERCHRRLLAEECRRLSEYSAKIVHL